MNITNININNIYANTTHKTVIRNKNIAFKSSVPNYDSEDLGDYFCSEKNLKEIYGTEYEPVEYNKIFANGYEGNTVLPSQRNIKHESTFRDEELFYDDVDIKTHYAPFTYDKDDVPLCQDLWMGINKNHSQDFFDMDTNIFGNECNYGDSVYKPWVTKDMIISKELEEKLLDNVYYKFRDIPNADYKVLKKIFKCSEIQTNRKIKPNPALCFLAIDLYQNSKEWTPTEVGIMKEVKNQLFQSIYIGYSEKKYDFVINCLEENKTNEEILNLLKEQYSGCEMKLDTIFSKEEIDELLHQIND